MTRPKKQHADKKPFTVSEREMAGSWTVEIVGKPLERVDRLEEVSERFGLHPVHEIRGQFIIHKRKA